MSGTSGAHFVNRRRHERFRLPPMYSSVTARPLNVPIGELAGHAYDISEGGVRIELDQPLDVGQSVAIDLDLPGEEEPIAATGDVVWINDADDDPGPRRMALRFRRFETTADRLRLQHFLGGDALRAAA